MERALAFDRVAEAYDRARPGYPATFIDTALAYGDGHSEQLVGQVLSARPGEAYVATKVPPRLRR